MTEAVTFQFQYGTIKAKVGNDIVLPIVLFQFQYGTIKAETTCEYSAINLHFNSSMVRLKLQKSFLLHVR